MASIKPIVILDLNGNFIKEFKLASDAAKWLGNIQPSNLHRVLSGTRKRYKNYLILYKDKYENTNKPVYNNSISKSVLQFDKNNNFIKEWNSTMDIERELNIKNTAISACCLNKKHYLTAGGFKWKYK